MKALLASRFRLLAVSGLPWLLAACAIIPAAKPPVTPPPNTSQASSAALSTLTPGPNIATLHISAKDAQSALSGFLESCPKLLKRTDASGLTQSADWRSACDAATNWKPEKARGFFATHFETVRIGDGRAFATGYFEPEITGSRSRLPGFDVPVYAVPRDLERAWPATTPHNQRTERAPLGRYDEKGDFVPYFSRAEIEEDALEGRAELIGWAKDPVEFFFLQIQGSGRLRAPNGDVVRIGYAGQNGHGYTSIGKLMRERGLLGDGPGQYAGSMQGIMAYIRENPEQGRALMRENKSWIFFRELTGDGPIGALGVPVRREASVAADPRFVPLGAPVWLDLDRDEADGMWIAQDTGGAIKGANRFDTFWGAGKEARSIAGGMSGRGEALILLPKGSISRLNGSEK